MTCSIVLGRNDTPSQYWRRGMSSIQSSSGEFIPEMQLNELNFMVPGDGSDGWGAGKQVEHHDHLGCHEGCRGHVMLHINTGRTPYVSLCCNQCRLRIVLEMVTVKKALSFKEILDMCQLAIEDRAVNQRDWERARESISTVDSMLA